MSVNIPKLNRALATGHPVTGAYSDDDAAALAQLRAENINIVRPFEATIKSIASRLGVATSDALVTALEAVAQASPTVRHILAVLESGGTVDLGDAATRGQLDAMAENNLLTAEQATAIKGLAEATISHEAVLGLAGTQLAHIEKARTP